MKKVSLILAAFALVLGLSQCKKEEKPAQSGEKQHIVLTASNGNDGSKVSGQFVTDALNLTWENGDEITVSGGAEGMLTLKSGAGEVTATFEGDVTIEDATTTVCFTVGSAPTSYQTQTGTEDGCAAWIKNNNHFVGESAYVPSGNYNNVQMNLQYAVLKLDVSALGTSGAMTIAVGGSTIASVEDVSLSEGGKAVFVAVPADGTKKTYTISCGDKIGVKIWTLAKNMFYTAADEYGYPTGDAIVIVPTPNKFTVNANGNTVKFALGNLWYNPSDLKFYFENNQWDFEVGDFHSDYLSYYDWVPNHVSHFYWNKDASVAYAEEYFDDEDILRHDVFFTDHGGFTVNGETGWRTLSKDEWDYLINTRVVNGDTGYGRTCVWATVEDVSGLIIFHDGYNGATSELTSIPDGCVFLPAAGGRNDEMVFGVGTMGNYWSNTLSNLESAGVLNFSLANAQITENYVDDGFPVRLVRCL